MANDLAEAVKALGSPHSFYNDGDDGIPRDICDTHGSVVLSLCKICGQAEGDLEPACPGPKEGPKEKAQKQRAARKVHPKITMGCVAAILGVSPSMTRAQVTRQLVRQYHGAESEYVANIAAEYNEQMRDTACVAFENQMRRNLIRVDIAKPLVKHLSSHPIMVRSDKHEGHGLVFIRTPFGQRDIADKSLFKSLDDQPHMYAQMQVEMHLSGAKWGVFFQWAVMAQTAKIVELDAEFVGRCLDQLAAYYENEYKAEVKNPDHLEALLPSVDNKKVRDALAEYDELCISEDNIKSRKAELMAFLVSSAKDRSVMVCGRKLLKIEKQGAISYSAAVKKLLPGADLEAYRGKPSTAWKLD